MHKFLKPMLNYCDYFANVYSDALDNHMGLIISRVREGFDYSNILEEDSEEVVENLTRCESSTSVSTSKSVY